MLDPIFPVTYIENENNCQSVDKINTRGHPEIQIPKMSFFISLLVWVLLSVSGGSSASGTLSPVYCTKESNGVHGQQSMLNCTALFVNDDVTIIRVIWAKNETRILEYHEGNFNPTNGFQFAVPDWNNKNRNVSLLLTNTKMEDMGEYTCTVETESGLDTKIVNLSVKAMPTPQTDRNRGLKPTEPPEPPQSRWIAPVVVIGSLIVGLLAALLLFKRRSRNNNGTNPSNVPTEEDCAEDQALKVV
ncbi:hypothetical protein DPEC_G00174440 [Dallia pectoralis]|uniref:Uncharacterized protein n=1 Tax=Dallia pectoralis TaxID=75939 RepID=A0ACC2GE53_DALPE|nr:hypothetical protein DPEC_G00174440 [Dallia pectoralis]